MPPRVLRALDYQRMRWKNGGGWTTELAAQPCAGAEPAFDWRISVAEVDSDGAFSTFPDCERIIALLEGVGMELTFDAAPAVRLERRLAFERFAGEWQTYGRLISGPVRDFNVIVRRDAIAADVWHRPLVGPMVFLPGQNTWFAYLASGRAEVKLGGVAHAMEAGESLLIPPDPAGERVVLHGGGELALVKLMPRPDRQEEGPR